VRIEKESIFKKENVERMNQDVWYSRYGGIYFFTSKVAMPSYATWTLSIPQLPSPLVESVAIRWVREKAAMARLKTDPVLAPHWNLKSSVYGI